MQLHTLKPNTPRRKQKRVGRGGKKGTFSGHGTKGQKSRAGAGVKADFRGGDNRIWQLFPKQRGASKRPGAGNPRPHRKHRFFQISREKAAVISLNQLNVFDSETVINPMVLAKRGLIEHPRSKVKILDNGTLKVKLHFENIQFSVSAREAVEKAGGIIK